MTGLTFNREGYGNYKLELDSFARILNGHIYNTEEVRFERPQNYLNSFEYVGLAPLGSLPTDPVWDCVRCSWVNNRKIRMQFQAKIPWETRSVGW